MTEKEYEQLMTRAINGDVDALNEVEPEIRARLEKEIENGNPFLTLFHVMFDPYFFGNKMSEFSYEAISEAEAQMVRDFDKDWREKARQESYHTNNDKE